MLRRAEIGDHQAATFVLGGMIGLPSKSLEPAPIKVNQYGEQNQAIIARGRVEELEHGGEPAALIEGGEAKMPDANAAPPKKRRRRKVKDAAPTPTEG